MIPKLATGKLPTIYLLVEGKETKHPRVTRAHSPLPWQPPHTACPPVLAPTVANQHESRKLRILLITEAHRICDKVCGAKGERRPVQDIWLGRTGVRTAPHPTQNATIPKDENGKRRSATENERVQCIELPPILSPSYLPLCEQLNLPLVCLVFLRHAKPTVRSFMFLHWIGRSSNGR